MSLFFIGVTPAFALDTTERQQRPSFAMPVCSSIPRALSHSSPSVFLLLIPPSVLLFSPATFKLLSVTIFGHLAIFMPCFLMRHILGSAGLGALCTSHDTLLDLRGPESACSLLQNTLQDLQAGLKYCG